jgi:hypothetical protein
VTRVDEARERILSKIRKLQALAQSSNEHEAAAAAERAAELLAEHQICEAELGVASVIDEGISERRGPRPTDWEASLVRGIGAGTGARVYFERRGPRGRITEGSWKAIGTPDQVATARYLLQALRREIERLSDRAYDAAFPRFMCREMMGVVPCAYLTGQLRCHRCGRPKQARGDARGWKAQWRLGCAIRVGIRLERARAESLARARAAARAGEDGAPSTMALVRVDSVQADIAKLCAQYEFKQAPPVELDRENIDALVRGSIAGDQIPISGGPGLAPPAEQLEGVKRR